MVVTIKKGGKPTQVIQSGKPKPTLKLKKAIDNPHQFTIKITPKQKIALKIWAAEQSISVNAMLIEALEDLISRPPPEMPPYTIAGDHAARHVFKVTQQMAADIHALADMGITYAHTALYKAYTQRRVAIEGRPADKL